MKKMTTKEKAHNTRKANAGHSKQAQRKLHKKKITMQLRAQERYYRRTRGGEETLVL